MSQFNGPQKRGAMRERRLQKRKEAEKRNAVYQERKLGEITSEDDNSR